MSEIRNMPIRAATGRIIFKTDTPAGKAFDVVLIACILLSVVAVMLDSIPEIDDRYKDPLYYAEWFFTILFSIEYVLRVWSIRERAAYIFSFFGVVDLIAIVPTYLSLLVPGAQYLIVLRILRVLRVFRILKFYQYMSESNLLLSALYASRRKISVFLLAVLTIVTIIGSLMYLIEGAENGFTSIPRSIYWSIVTLTTVGYGDISPRTPPGQVLASIIMILGYGIIAVPTGIVTVELGRQSRTKTSLACEACGLNEHESDAEYCRKCGTKLEEVS